jgi:zinc protease
MVALLAVVPRAGAAAEGDIFPYAVHERTLDNGLRIVAIPYESPGIVSFYVVIRTGSRDEVEPGHSGFAHFFEHMMFRGTEKHPSAEYNEILKRMGADSNAYTSDDRTVYHITGPARELERLVELEADRFMNLEYTESEFKTEAGAVLGEYNKSASNPFLGMTEKLRDLAFTSHTYKHTTIGFLADIKAMPTYYDYSLGFFDRFYRPDNAHVLVVGDIQPDRVFDVVSRHFGAWKRGYKPADIRPEAPQRERRTAKIDWPNPTRPYMLVGYHTPAFSTDTVDFAALDVIAQLLFSESAPLYQELVVDKQSVDFISGGAEDHRDPYLFSIAARIKVDTLVPQVKETVDRHIVGLQEQPVDATRLERIKSHLRYSFALGLSTPDDVADKVAHYVALTGSVGTINQLYRRYQEVTPADIQRVAKQVFRPENETMVTLAQASRPSQGTKSEGSR